MTTLPFDPSAVAGTPARHGLLPPTLRRDLADLNGQFLDLSLAGERTVDPSAGWAEPVRRRLREIDRPENQRFIICMSNAFTQASRELATAPPLGGGLGGLLKLISDPGVQEGLRLLAFVGSRMSASLREVHRRGL